MDFKCLTQNIILTVVLMLLSVSCTEKTRSEKKVVEKAIKCQKIVSTAPSITETLFKFGFGDRVVGVTDDCSYPEDALKKEKIGRVLDINLEKLILLKPDTVMIISANPDLISRVRAIGLNVLTFDHTTLNGFIDSLSVIAEECGKEEELSSARRRYRKIVDGVTGKIDRKVLISIGRSYHSNSIKDVYVAGNDGFFSEILKTVGVKNSYEGKLSYPKIQIEGIISMNPDIIIDIVPPKEFSHKDRKKLTEDWMKLKDVKAVKNKKVFVIDKNYWSIPGPRFVNIIEELGDMVKVDE